MISKIAMARLAMVKNRDFEAIAMVNQIKTIPLYIIQKKNQKTVVILKEKKIININ